MPATLRSSPTATPSEPAVHMATCWCSIRQYSSGWTFLLPWPSTRLRRSAGLAWVGPSQTPFSGFNSLPQKVPTLTDVYSHPTSPSLETAFPYPGSALIVASTVTRFALPVNQGRRSSSYPACISLQPQSQPCEAALEAFSNNSGTADTWPVSVPCLCLLYVQVHRSIRKTIPKPLATDPPILRDLRNRPTGGKESDRIPLERVAQLAGVCFDRSSTWYANLNLSPLALSSGSIGWQDGYSYTQFRRPGQFTPGLLCGRRLSPSIAIQSCVFRIA